jgi:tetratricopeptide (TPR) repeat protein
MRTSLRPFRKVGQASSLSLIRDRKQAGSLFHFVAMSSVLCLLSSVLTACSPQQKQPTAMQDKPLAAFQTNLLQTAFDFATAIPVVPHIKDRSRSQEAVVTACLELNQPQRALGYIEKIGDWRRGAGYADYAFYCTQNGFTNDVKKHLNLAEQISSIADQDWRRDRILVKIASVCTLLGDDATSSRLTRDIEPSESGKIEQTHADQCTESAFNTQFEALRRLIATENFDIVKNALSACVRLFDRFYQDAERRSLIEKTIRESWNSLPRFVHIDLLAGMSEAALDHADLDKARELLNDAKTIFDGAGWKPQHGVPIMARLAELRFRCGEAEAARAELRAALELFNGKQSEIINIDKAETLIPVAEAFQTTGDSAKALAAYKQAVEVAVENLNSRPRAEDLSAICVSMARTKTEPDEALWKRIREIQANLTDPW